MRISSNWLREYFATPLPSDEQLIEDLCQSGTEATLERDTDNADKMWYKSVVVATIVDTTQHPDAKSLQVCQVVVGGSNKKTIVCGGHNARTGIKVALAPVGSKLPDNITIKKTTIRGVESQGMLCSACELKLGDDHDAIIELSADAEVGNLVADHLKLAKSAVIDCEILPNRGDCLSVLGIVRELAALYNTSFTSPTTNAAQPMHDEKPSVTVMDSAACPLYSATLITVDMTRKTPDWMQERLQASNVACHNLVVDITNYVMLELGQPLHAFDASCVTGTIKVGWAEAGTTVTLLNNKTITLDADVLTIADQKGVIGLAGIMGSLNSSCTQNTQSIILESALFMPQAVAGRARRYGLQTDAATRFERGIDAQGVIRAAEYACALLVSLAGGKVGETLVTRADRHIPIPATITVDAHYVNQVLGTNYNLEALRALLIRLQFTCQNKGQYLVVTPPSYRWDINIKEDITEEILRLEGVGSITTQKFAIPVSLTATEDRSYFYSRISKWLTQNFYEAINYSFLDEQSTSHFCEQKPLKLQNPIAPTQAAMRTSILPSLLYNIQHNRARGFTQELRLFETAPVYHGTLETLTQTQMVAGIVAAGKLQDWQQPSRCDFFWMKQQIHSLLSAVPLTKINWTPAERRYLHPSKSASVRVQKTPIGYIGFLHPSISTAFDIKEEIILFELYLDTIYQLQIKEKRGHYKKISNQPIAQRDFAFIADCALPFAQLRSYIRRYAGEDVRAIRLFDVYQGKPLATGKKSLAVRLEWQNASRSLAESEIEIWSHAIIDGVAKHGIAIRDK